MKKTLLVAVVALPLLAACSGADPIESQGRLTSRDTAKKAVPPDVRGYQEAPPYVGGVPGTDEGKPLVPIHASYRKGGASDWLMSRDADEGVGYEYNGIAYRLFPAPPNHVSHPIYRCVDENGTHFQTPYADCEGVGTLESALGFAYTYPDDGAQAIYRCIGEAGYPIVTTTRISDCDPFVVQPIILGYTFPASAAVVP